MKARHALDDLRWRWRSHSHAAKVAWCLIVALFALSFVWMLAPWLAEDAAAAAGMKYRLASMADQAAVLLALLGGLVGGPQRGDRMGQFVWGILIVLTVETMLRRGLCNLQQHPFAEVEISTVGGLDMRASCERLYGTAWAEWLPIGILVAGVGFVAWRVFVRPREGW